MGKMTDWVKANVKEGANVAEFEEIESKLSLESIDSKEQVIELMNVKDSPFQKARNSMVQKAVLSHDETFRAEKLPGLIEAEKTKIMAEVNPPKTEEGKKLAEVEASLHEIKLEKAQSDLKLHLVSKAKDVGYPEKRAERFAVYGDQAEQQMAEEAEFLKSHIKKEVESEVKRLYGDQTPPKQSAADPSKVVGRADYDNMNPQAQSDFVAGGGSVED